MGTGLRSKKAVQKEPGTIQSFYLKGFIGFVLFIGFINNGFINIFVTASIYGLDHSATKASVYTTTVEVMNEC